jgi:hypothetical protein
VPEYCTCGAKLPEDARFCHKCGRPTRDEPVFVEEEPLAPPPAPPPPAAPQFPPIGFRNGPAVRAALLSGSIAFVLLIIAGQIGVPAASMIGLVAGGFLAVYLYQRRTGQSLSVVHGAHLGWISGVFDFALMALVLSAKIPTLSDPILKDALRKQLQGAGSQAEVDQVIQVLLSPPGMMAVAAMIFLMFTVLPACGGALGAKLLHRD